MCRSFHVFVARLVKFNYNNILFNELYWKIMFFMIFVKVYLLYCALYKECAVVNLFSGNDDFTPFCLDLTWPVATLSSRLVIWISYSWYLTDFGKMRRLSICLYICMVLSLTQTLQKSLHKIGTSTYAKHALLDSLNTPGYSEITWKHSTSRAWDGFCPTSDSQRCFSLNLFVEIFPTITLRNKDYAVLNRWFVLGSIEGV